MPVAPPGAERARPAGAPLWVFLPLLVLCLALAVACIVCAALIPPQTALAWAVRAVPLAVCATLACLVLAIVPALQGGGLLWVLLLWLSPALGGLGWALSPAPRSVGGEMARVVLLTLPLMMSLLAGAWSRLPEGVLRAAAAAGAPPSTRFWLLLRLRLPGAAQACVPVGLVCLALIGPGPALR